MTQIISDADRDNFLRLPEQGLKLYLSVYRPDTVWEGTLDSAVFPAGFLTVSTTDGDIEDVLEGYTMNVYEASGEFKGWLRVRKDNSSATQIDISEIGFGYLDIHGNDVLTVTAWRRPTAKFHRYDSASAEWLADYDLEVGTKNTDIGPLARVGPPAVGFRDGGGDVTLKFVGSASETYTDGGSIAGDGYAWLWPESNDAATAGTPGSPHAIEFNDAHPKGAEYSLEVTDSADETHKRYGVMWTHDRDGANAPYKVSQAILDTTLGQGALCQMFLYGEFTEAQLPRDAYICLWSEINYGGTIKDNIGGTYPFRANVMFAGYVVNETQVVTGQNDQKFTEIRAASIDTVMQNLATYPIEQISIPGSASDWSNIKDLTVARGMASLTKWRAHLDMLDVNTGDYSDDQPINYLDPPEGTIWEQLEYYYLNTLMGRVGVSLGGDLYGNADHQLTPDNDQWLSSPALSIEQADLTGEVRINYRSYPDTAQANVSGVDGDEPLYSQAPGFLKGYIGTPTDQPPGFAPVDQNDLNEMTGKLLSYNNRLIESVTIPLGYYVNLDANPQTLVNLTVSTTDHPRGFDDFASGKDLLITRVRFNFTDDWNAFTTIDCEPAIERVSLGVTVIMPQTPATNYGDFAMPAWEYDNAWDVVPLPSEIIDSANAGDLIVLGELGGGLTHDLAQAFVAGTLNYENISTGLPADGIIIDATFVTGEETAYACVESGSIETAGVYKRANAWNSGSTWELQYSEADLRSITGPETVHADGLGHHFGGIDFADEFVYANASYTSGVVFNKTIPANVDAPGTNTTIAVTSGNDIQFSASGLWAISAVSGNFGPDGKGDPADPSFLLPSGQQGELIGRIGTTGSWFSVGSSASISAPATGDLYMTMNDVTGSFGDNTGSVEVEVTIGTSGTNHRRYLVFDGSTWSLENNYTDYITANVPGALSAFGVSANNSGVVFAPVYDAAIKWAKSTDSAATFASVGTIGSFVEAANIPFEDNAADNTQWIGADDGEVKRSTDQGVNWSDITMPGGWSGDVAPQSIHSLTSDSDIIAVANENDQFATSANGNGAPPTFTVKTSLADTPFFVGGWPDDPLWFAVASDTDVEVSDDGGATWNSAFGDLATIGITSARWVIPRFVI